MEYMFPSRNNEILLVNSEKLTGVNQITNSSQEEEPPMFLQFPSPFHDDMDITTILPNLHHHHTSTERCTTTTINSQNNPLKLINTTTNSLPSKVKSVRKRRSIAVKKDRHSKIHTAQGLRDRRMRLSVHTARKFFDLNDMLGFDKASKTIEWLFSKSRKAIEEVTESLDSDDTTLALIKENLDCKSHMSGCETEPVVEIQSDHDHESSKKAMESYPLVNFQQPQLGFVENKDNHNMKEPSCFPVDYSNIYHFVKHLHLDNKVRTPDVFLGINNNNTMSSADCSIVDYTKTISEPPAGWLNSRNTFLGFLGGWDSENSRMESNNGIVPTPLTGNVNGENPCFGTISTSKLAYFHSQNQAQ